MAGNKKYLEFIASYMQSKYHKSYSDRDHDYFCYSSNKGKFGVSNILFDILWQEFSPIQVKLFIGILSRVKQSDDFFESGVVRLVAIEYADQCSVNSFGPAIKKYVEYNFLVATPKNKYFILNPLYINKFYKLKEKK